MFDAWARRHPGDRALIYHREDITYRQLLDLVSEVRGRLREFGIPEGCPVCVSAKKSPETIALVIACLSDRRRILLPATDLGDDVLHTLCQLSSCSHILTVRRHTNGPASVAVKHVFEPDKNRFAAMSCLPTSEDVGLLLTTSGSTGVPKIVPISMAGVDRFMSWAAEQFDIAPGTTVLSYAPLNFDLSLLDVWTTLRFGGCVSLVDQDRATDTGYLLRLFETDIHVIQSVPMLYRLLADGADIKGRVFDSVEHVVFTGDVTPPGLALRLVTLFPMARFYNVYGCTETNDSLLHKINIAELHQTEKIPVGQPVPGVDALVVDAKGELVAGPGTGELWISTPFQTAGYLESRRNDGVFVCHPDGNSPGRYYRTGDLVTRHGNGTILLEGRNDFHVKVRGVRTNTQEIEQAILDHPQVREVIVVALPEEVAGTRLHALVERQSGSDLNSLGLRTYCSRKLPRTAIPASISIVDEPVPRTATGKPDRNLVKQNQLGKVL
jgi:acyl-coenzyme A synthetase/AMP-(fatty) acid ligase